MAFTADHSERCRRDFPALQRDVVFLDGPGGVQVPTAVIQAMTDFYQACNVNTHGNFGPSREVDRKSVV